MAKSSKIRLVGTHLLIASFAFVMIYPLLWIVASSFKPSAEIFSSPGLIPSQIIWDSYAKGWAGIGQQSFGIFFINTFKLVIPTVLFTVASSTLVAYGFARMDFPLRKLMFSLMLSTLMLPGTILIIPRYLLFKSLDWLNTYLPFYIPALLAGNSFFIFMLVQFLRGIPRELDESAVVDGCNSFMILYQILLPLCKPALLTVALMQFIWVWNDFFNPLIYINSVSKYPLALGLRISIDVGAIVNWNQVLAMAVVAIIPPITLFVFTQKYFVEGIATTGLKG
jgi:oligogalacturonide transport system permease protein